MADEVKFSFHVTDDGTLQVFDQAGRKLREVGVIAEDTGKRGEAGFGLINRGALVAAAGIAAAGLALRSAVGHAREWIDAAAEQERATGLLNAQLRSTGQFSDAYSQRLQAQATALQRVTATSDETILGVQRQLIAFGASEQQMDRLTRAALDLSTGMGKDVSGAAFLLGKALAGEFGTLSRFGILVDENASKSEKLEQALQQIEARFGGQAAAAAETFTGRLEGLSLQLGEVEEALGNIVVESPAVQTMLEHLSEGASDTAEAINLWVDANRELIDSGLTQFFTEVERTGRAALPVIHDLGSAMIALNEGRISVGDFLGDIAVHVGGFAQPITLAQGVGRRIEENRTAIDAMMAEQRARFTDPFTSGGLNFSPDVTSESVGAFGAFGDVFTGTGHARFGGGVRRPTVAGAGSTDVRAARDAAKAAAREQRETEAAITQEVETQLALLDAQVDRRDTAVEFAKQDLDLLRQHKAPMDEQIAAAEKLDSLEVSRLEAQRERLSQEVAYLELAQRVGYEVEADLAKAHVALDKTNQELQRAQDPARGMADEIRRAADEAERANEIVLTLGQSLQGSLSGAVDALVHGGDIGEALKNQFEGAAIGAIGQGLGLVLDKVVNNIFGGGGGGLGTAPVTGGNSISQGFQAIKGLFGGAGGGGAPAGPTQDAFGSSFSGAGAAEAAAAQGGASSAAQSAASAIPLIGLAVIAIDSTIKGLQAAHAEARRFGATDESIAGAAYGQLPVIGSLVSLVGEEDAGKFLRGPGGAIIDPIGFALARWAFQAPTRGTQAKAELSDLLEDAGLPRQRGISGGGRSGVRVPRFEEAPTLADLAAFEALGFVPGRDISGVTLAERGPEFAGIVRAATERPDVNRLRTGAALGLFATLFPDPTTIAASTNAFVSNAQELGLSAEETDRQLKKLAATSGVTLITGLEELNRKFVEGDLNESILMAGVTGLVELFEDDLPAGVDAAALAIENFSEKGGVDIANFTEDLEDAVEVFGKLQATAEAGIGGAAFAGIGGQVGAFRAYDRFMGGYGSLGDVSRAGRDAHEAFISSLYESALGGGAEAITTLATQEIQKLPEYDAFLDALAEAVKPGGGGLGDLPFRIQDLADAAGESIDAAAQTMQAFQDAFSITPTALREQAQSIEQSIEDFRFGLLTPRQQSQQLHRRVSELEAELATTTDPVRRQEILSELAGLGFDIAQLAQARGLRGNAFKREVNYGLGVSERAGTGLESLADRQGIPTITAPVATIIETSAQTIATSNNTLVRALHRLTVVIESAPQSIDINVPAGRTINDEQLERVILRLIDRSPRVRKRVQQGAGLG